MEELVVRRIKNENDEEIIELDLNRSMPRRGSRYASYMDEVERLARSPRKHSKEFITVLR